jgi:hypothetical protein
MNKSTARVWIRTDFFAKGLLLIATRKTGFERGGHPLISEFEGDHSGSGGLHAPRLNKGGY